MNTFIHPARSEAQMLFFIAFPILLITSLSAALWHKFQQRPEDKHAWYVDPQNITYGIGVVYVSGAFFGLVVSDGSERNLNRVLANEFLANALGLDPHNMSTLEICAWSALVVSSCFAIMVLICYTAAWIGHHVGQYCDRHGIRPSWNEPVIIRPDDENRT